MKILYRVGQKMIGALNVRSQRNILKNRLVIYFKLFDLYLYAIQKSYINSTSLLGTNKVPITGNGEALVIIAYQSRFLLKTTNA